MSFEFDKLAKVIDDRIKRAGPGPSHHQGYVISIDKEAGTAMVTVQPGEEPVEIQAQNGYLPLPGQQIVIQMNGVEPVAISQAVMVDGNMASKNYVQGVSGWAIDATGNAELNNLLARGSLRTGDDGEPYIILSDGEFSAFMMMFPGVPVSGPAFFGTDTGTGDEVRTVLTGPTHGSRPGSAFAPQLYLSDFLGSGPATAAVLSANQVELTARQRINLTAGIGTVGRIDITADNGEINLFGDELNWNGSPLSGGGGGGGGFTGVPLGLYERTTDISVSAATWTNVSNWVELARRQLATPGTGTLVHVVSTSVSNLNFLVAGLYRVTATVDFGSGVASNGRGMRLYHSSGGVNLNLGQAYVGTLAPQAMSGSAILYCPSATTFGRISVYSDVAATVEYARVSVEYLGP